MRSGRRPRARRDEPLPASPGLDVVHVRHALPRVEVIDARDLGLPATVVFSVIRLLGLLKASPLQMGLPQAQCERIREGHGNAATAAHIKANRFTL